MFVYKYSLFYLLFCVEGEKMAVQLSQLSRGVFWSAFGSLLLSTFRSYKACFLISTL